MAHNKKEDNLENIISNEDVTDLNDNSNKEEDITNDQDVDLNKDLDNNECDCNSSGTCNCLDDCECKDCKCEENDKNNQYLNLAKQIQADFDNFRRHAVEDIKKSRLDGQISVIEVFLPCIDTFKEAKKSINDENILKGIEMIEENILNALNNIGVEKIDSIGEKFDPHLHNVIAVMKDENQENDIILDEFQAGYKFNDKIIRYAKVIVNKKEG